ncbi:MAG TPA: FxSxx-COOH system tetratricopeptide repeat protein [Ktedonobacteraceae bacterium]|jgi:tetratricopeptide (TPR) repeat protein/transcriptional regulator with XRE-family HTH domain
MDASSAPLWKGRIRQERTSHNWRQQDLADQLGTTVVTIQRWERGTQQPSAYFRTKLCTLFSKSAEEMGFVDPVQKASADMKEVEAVFPSLWNVPYPRNPFFTGRDDILATLHKQLCQCHRLALTQSLAVSGLGGIGKTQIALEYAYRYGSSYTAVFWLNAETLQTLLSSFYTLAQLLALPESKAEHDLTLVVHAVCRWLSLQKSWLLIFDNVEQLEILTPYLPSLHQGALLLTTRLQALGAIAQPIIVGPMEQAEGMLFLLQRSKVLHPDMPLSTVASADLQAAHNMVTQLGGLPLALDQAGAYIEEAGCEIARYSQLYQEHAPLLLKRRGRVGEDHPQSVDATVAFAVERVQAQAPAAVDLLRLCAFLCPENIPQELFVCKAGSASGPKLSFDPLEWDEVLGVLRRYSLITRQAEEGLLSLHRLVQVVLKAQMDQASYRQWACQAIETVNRGFPAVELLTTWSQCQRVLPHALACATIIEEEQVISEAAGRLLHQIGAYLLEGAQYAQAESYLTRAYAQRVCLFGEQHPATAESLNYQAELAYYQGNYSQAEQLHLQALRIREQELGPQHPDIAISLNNLASAYWIQGKYRQAEPFYRRALQIREEVLGSEHLDTAEALQNLGSLLLDQERYDEAEPLYERSLKICQRVLGHDHLYLMTIWNGLGRLYRAQGRYAEARQIYLQAKVLGEQVHATQHPHYAMTLNNLGKLACIQQEWKQAEYWYRQALQIRESVLGPEKPRTVQTLHDLATLYDKQGQVERADEMYQQVLALREKILPPDHPDTAETLHRFAVLREAQGNVQQAIALYQRALSIREQVFGAQHPKTTGTRQRLSAALQTLQVTK